MKTRYAIAWLGKFIILIGSAGVALWTLIGLGNQERCIWVSQHGAEDVDCVCAGELIPTCGEMGVRVRPHLACTYLRIGWIGECTEAIIGAHWECDINWNNTRIFACAALAAGCTFACAYGQWSVCLPCIATAGINCVGCELVEKCEKRNFRQITEDVLLWLDESRGFLNDCGG